MQRIIILFVLLSLLILSCTKKEYITEGDTSNPDYTINGLTEITLYKRDTISVPIELNWVKGTQKNVRLSFVNIPEKITTSVNPAGGIPGFKATIGIGSHYAKPGSYNLKLLVTDSLKTDTFSIKLNIKLHNNCIEEILGYYKENSMCNGGSYDWQLTPYYDNWIHIVGPSVYTHHIDARVHCDNDSIDIPKQTVYSGIYLPNSIYGYGKIYYDSLVVNYWVTDSLGINIDSCISVLK